MTPAKIRALRKPTQKNTMNAREILDAASKWLSWQDEDLSFGLKSAEDAIRLYAYAQTHPELPEMADSWEPKHRKKAIGYDPINRLQAITDGPAKFTNKSPQRAA